MKSNIALSTSLSWNNNWDPYFSIDITKKWNIDNCQIFLGDNFDQSLSKGVADYCKDKVSILVHSPVDLNSNALDQVLNNKIKNLMINNKSMVVYHHDPDYPIKNTIDVIKEINKLGFTVLLENFYKVKTRVKDTLNHYVELLSTANKENCMILPLFDIPRLFIEDIDNYIDPLNETIEILKVVKELSCPLYLHMIDCLSKSQTRETWCCVGKGYIPYKTVFEKIAEFKIDIPVAVLEYEDESHIEKSLEYLREFDIFK